MGQELLHAVHNHSGPASSDVELELDLIAGMAALLAPTDGERAVELAALARHHPMSQERIKARSQALLDRQAAQVPPAVFATARERGRLREPWGTVEELLAELQGNEKKAA